SDSPGMRTNQRTGKSCKRQKQESPEKKRRASGSTTWDRRRYLDESRYGENTEPQAQRTQSREPLGAKRTEPQQTRNEARNIRACLPNADRAPDFPSH